MAAQRRVEKMVRGDDGGRAAEIHRGDVADRFPTNAGGVQPVAGGSAEKIRWRFHPTVEGGWCHRHQKKCWRLRTERSAAVESRTGKPGSRAGHEAAFYRQLRRDQDRLRAAARGNAAANPERPEAMNILPCPRAAHLL